MAKTGLDQATENVEVKRDKNGNVGAKFSANLVLPPFSLLASPYDQRKELGGRGPYEHHITIKFRMKLASNFTKSRSRNNSVYQEQ